MASCLLLLGGVAAGSPLFFSLPISPRGFQVSALVSYGGEGLEALSGMELATPLLVQAESEASEADLAGEGSVRVTSKEYVALHWVPAACLSTCAVRTVSRFPLSCVV